MACDLTSICGSLFLYALLTTLSGSAFLVFFRLWKLGRLDMDEQASIEMMSRDLEESKMFDEQK